MSDTYYDMIGCEVCGKEFKEGDEVRYTGGEVVDEMMRIRIEDPAFYCVECYERMVVSK